MDKSQIFTAMVGQWYQLLSARMDLPPVGRHGSCPCCGGVDRFRFTDHKQRGGSWCNQCEPNSRDGLQLMMDAEGMTFQQALAAVGEWLGMAPESRPPSRTVTTNATTCRPKDNAGIVAVIGRNMQPVYGSLAETYLKGRGIDIYKLAAPHLLYWLPRYKDLPGAMVAQWGDGFGNFAGFHLIRIDDTGQAIRNERGRKQCQNFIHEKIAGCGLWLSPVRREVIVSESIEDCLSYAQLHGHRCHGMIATGGEGQMRSLQLPAEVREVIIAADGDHIGKEAAATLERRLIADGLQVSIRFPPNAKDWNQALQEKNAQFKIPDQKGKL